MGLIIDMLKKPNRHWLAKSEPSVYGIDDLERDGKTSWDGIRNYQARNIMRDHMRPGDGVLFYHSNSQPAGIAGVARVAGNLRPDPSQFDSRSKYFDPASSPEDARWLMLDMEFVEKFPRLLPLSEIAAHRSLKSMLVAQRGMRLSIQPVEKTHFDLAVALAKKAPTPKRG